MEKRLTAKQEAFCRAIVAGKNQSDAYRQAFHCRNMRDVTVNVEASRLMNHPGVARRIQELDAPAVARIQMKRTEWWSRLEKVACYDVRKMFDESGKLLAITDMPENERFAIAGFEVVEHFSGKGENRKVVGATKKFKLIDRLKALEILGKAKGFYKDNEVDEDRIPKSIKVVFVDAKGAPVQLNMANPPPKVSFRG